MLCTRQLGCMQILTADRILMNMSLASAGTLDGYLQYYREFQSSERAERRGDARWSRFSVIWHHCCLG